MTEAKDTLLSPDKMDEIINMATKLNDPMPILEVMRFGDAVALAQDEISLKAGMKIVVEWFMQHERNFISEEVRRSGEYTNLLILDAEIRLQLKEWGIEEVKEQIK